MILNWRKKKTYDINDFYKNSGPNKKIADEIIINVIDSYIPSYTCHTAALGYLKIVSHVCYFRNHLSEPLLKIAIKPIVYLGFMDYKEVMQFIYTEFLHDKNIYYPPTKQGKEWLINELENNSVLIKDIFDEIVTEEDITFE